jgi:hypothetical protein
MFDDHSFTPVKGKTDELFSVLFHRRFVRPELAFSETTAYPANRLSAAHLAAKLVISTLADVRHTMFMSGLTPFPREHWSVLAPAMREQARLQVGRMSRPCAPYPSARKVVIWVSAPSRKRSRWWTASDGFRSAWSRWGQRPPGWQCAATAPRSDL